MLSAGPMANIILALLLLGASHVDMGRLGRAEKSHNAAQWRKGPIHRLAFELTYPVRRAAGPVGIVSAAGRIRGICMRLRFAAAVSAEIALFNMLPIFPLDGGRMLACFAPWVESDRLVVPQMTMVGILMRAGLAIDTEPLWRGVLHR